MMDWMNMLMQPQNREALLGTLAQKGMPPPEALQVLQAPQTPQMSQVPGAPGSFAEMMQQPGMPSAPPPQMSVDPNMTQGPAPIPFGAQPAQPHPAGLTAEQMAQLMGQGKGQEQGLRPPPPPGLMSGGAVRDQQMLAAQAQKAAPRASLAQLLYGR